MGFLAPRALAAPLRTRRSIQAILLACLTLTTTGLLAGSAAAAPTLSWAKSAATGQTAKGPLALSCAATSLCVAVEAEGGVLVGSSPGTTYNASWTKVAATGKDLTSVSCPSTTACVAVNTEGDAYTSSSPATNGSWHAAAAPVAAATDLTSVSCAPGTSTCVAVATDGDAYYSTDSGSTWSAADDIDGSTELTSVSCASASLCVAVDASGNELASAEPAAGKPWSSQQIANGSPLRAVSCEAAGVCVALDEAGYAIGTTNPTITTAFAATKVDGSPTLAADSCISGLCVALEQQGVAIASSAPTAVPASWSEATLTGIGSGASADAVACIPSSVCLALAAPTSSAGTLEAFTAAVPTPATETPPPKEAPVGVVTPSPKILGTPAAGQTLTCEPGLPSGATATVAYQWLGNAKPIAGATNPKYKVRSRNEGEHIQCEVKATNSAGSVAKTSSYVAIPLVKVPTTVGETTVGKALTRKGKASFAVLCSNRAIGACTIEAKLTVRERIRGTKVIAVSAGKPVAITAKSARARSASTKSSTTTSTTSERSEEVVVGSLKVTVKPGHERKLSVKLNVAGATLAAAHAKGLPTMLTVSGTVIGVMTGELHTQKLSIEPEGKAVKGKTRGSKTRKAKVRRTR